LLFANLHPVNLYASALGVASDYNVFVLNNFTETGADTGGGIAVGGAASFSGYYSIGQYPLTTFAGTDMLDVDTTITSGVGQVYNGNAYVGATGTGGVNMINGTLKTGGGDPINFASQATFLTSYATQLSLVAATGTVSDNYGTVTLSGTSSTLDVFDVPIADLGGNNTIDINNPSGATVLINVTGTSGTTTGAGMYINGNGANGNSTTTQADNVLFNFYQATSITFGGSVLGTVLAPSAAVTGAGQLDGGLIAKSFSGTTEFHNYVLTGTLPPYVPGVPEPTPLILCGSALVIAGLARRRRP
jgi:choice-of-anchor A domain-containing protein